MESPSIDGAGLHPQSQPDDRGSFHEGPRRDSRTTLGYPIAIAQANCSVSPRGHRALPSLTSRAGQASM